jgi:fumarate reductase subunit D
MARSNEPIFWSLFSAGGVVAAFFIPVTLVLTGIVVPAGWIEAESLRQFFAHPFTRLCLFVLISLSLFHWAHRFRYALADLGLRNFSGILAVACYCTAVLGTVLAGFFLGSG